MSLHDELRALTIHRHPEDADRGCVAIKDLRAILARHPEAAPVNICDPCLCMGAMAEGVHVRPQLQVQAPVGDSSVVKEDGVSDGERGGLRAAIDSVVDAILAAGYREQTLPSVDDVAKVLAHTDGGHHEALFDAGHESTIALYMRHATAILDLLKRGA